MFPTNISRFKPGMLPPEGRLSSPVGTLYSNPSTAADGVFGAGDGYFNISQNTFSDFAPGQIDFTPQVPGFEQLANIPAPYQNVARSTLEQKYQDSYFDANGKPIEGGLTNPVVYDVHGRKLEYDTATKKYERPSTDVFAAPTTTSSNSLVGNDIGANPDFLGMDTLRQIFPGRTAGEVNQIMSSMGYVPHMTNGQVVSYLRTQKANNPQAALGQQVQGSNKPEWLSPSEAASLAPGQTVDTKNAVFRGGTPTSADIGDTPAGTSQYAVTIKQNLDKKLEKEGAYVWKKYTKKDAQGNWVGYYVKELRKVYNKNSYKQRAARAEQDTSAYERNVSAAQAQAPGQEFNQLVTLRVNYG